jgi:hypothetical protein
MDVGMRGHEHKPFSSRWCKDGGRLRCISPRRLVFELGSPLCYCVATIMRGKPSTQTEIAQFITVCSA